MVLKVFKNESLEMIELETFFLFLSWHLDVWKSNDSKSFIQNQKFQKIFFFRMTETEKWNRLKNQLQTMKFAEVEQNQLRIGFQISNDSFLNQ